MFVEVLNIFKLKFNIMELSESKLRVLKYHFDLLKSQIKYKNYCDIIRLKIIPIIKTISPDLVKQLDDQNEKFPPKVKKVKSAIIKEVRDILKILKERLIQEKLLDEPNIKSSIENLESILHFQPEPYFIDGIYDVKHKTIVEIGEDENRLRKGVFAFPEQFDIAVERLKNIFHEMARLKKQDLIEDYVESFIYINEKVIAPNNETIFQCHECFKLIRFNSSKFKDIKPASKINSNCPICDNRLEQVYKYIYLEVPYIQYFNENTFVPSFFKLLKFNDEFKNSLAGAWILLNIIPWAWDIDNRDYLRKDLFFDFPNNCDRSIRLLSLNLLREEIKKAKNMPKKEGAVLNFNIFKTHVDIFKNHYFPNGKINTISSANGPEEILLKIVGLDLRLIVKWTEGLVEEYIMHTFHDDGKINFRCVFFENLLKNPNEFIELNEQYGDAKKYLKEARFEGLFYDLFIEDSNKLGAILKSYHLNLKNYTASKQRAINCYIQKFKSEGWKTNFS